VYGRHCTNWSLFILISSHLLSVLLIADTSYSYHPAIHDDTFVRRKQRRNRTTFTLQQVRKFRNSRDVYGKAVTASPRVFEISDKQVSGEEVKFK
jgi:hypothetical protein